MSEVLIIGAGPTGLFTAAELARHGVIPRVIDRCLTPHTQTRATGIQPAAMEVLHRAGLSQPFLAASVPVRGLRILDENMEEAFTLRPDPLPSPFTHTCSIPQWKTEEILNQHLATLGVTIERGVHADKITPTAEGVRVHCIASDGRAFTIDTAYLVGAGGAHGPTRKVLEQRLDGITYTRRFLVADVASQGVFRGDDLLHVAISKEGMLMIAELPQGRTLVVTDLPAGQEIPESPEIEDLRQVIARHLRKPFPISDLRWISAYRAHRRMSPRFADGRLFLAGDAAHLCSPLGGEGMNSGFLDAASLAWKLAAVLRHGGKPSLLAAYEPERQEVARQVLASSEATHDFYYSLVQRALEGYPLDAPPRDPTRKTTAPEMLDLTIGESPLLGYHGFYRTTLPVRPGHRFPHRSQLTGTRHHLLAYGQPEGIATFAARWSPLIETLDGTTICPPASAGTTPDGVALIRPDGYIAFQADHWNPPAQSALEELLLSQFHPPR